MAKTVALRDVAKLGYTVGQAWGSVEVEQTALDDAKAAADPQVVIEQVNAVTADTVQTLANIGKLPDDPAERLDLATKIGAAALEMLTEHVNEKVAFHERALEIAQTQPDVWHVSGPGLEIYVACKADGTGWDGDQQAMLDTLADPAAHKERVYQLENPEDFAAQQQAAAAADQPPQPKG